MMKRKSGFPFSSGLVFGFLVANFLCHYGIFDGLFRHSASSNAKSWRTASNVSHLAHRRGIPSTEPSAAQISDDSVLEAIQDKNISEAATAAQSAATVSQGTDAGSEETLSEIDLIEARRPLWTNFSYRLALAEPYPGINDGVAHLQHFAAPPGFCMPTGVPIARKENPNYGLDEEQLNSVQKSVRYVLKPDPPQLPYRGHVKVCMLWDYGYWWQDYIKLFGTCQGEDNCDIPCGNVHCRYSWQSQHFVGCTAVVFHHGPSALKSFHSDEPYLRKVQTITEPFHKSEVVALLSQMSGGAGRDIDVVAHWLRSAHVFLTPHNNQFSPKGEEEFVWDMNFSYLACPPKPDVALKTCVERRMGVAVFNNGNCGTAGGMRENYVQELRQHLQVDAYGSCLRSKPRPEVQGRWLWQHEIELRSHYKFCLSFENEVADDWVTEKVYHALAAGNVPVYFGASNIDDFLPCTQCVIQASRFAGPAELARYLIYLDQHPDEYMRWHAWRARPLKVPALMRASKAYAYCGICKAVADDIEGNLTHLEWDPAGRTWRPDPSRPPKPTPPTWATGFG